MALAWESVAVTHHNGIMFYVVLSCYGPYACNFSTLEAEAGPRVQGHNGFRASLGYMSSRKAMARNWMDSLS